MSQQPGTRRMRADVKPRFPRLLAVIDALLNRTSFSYDALNRRIAVVNALGKITTTVYDGIGQTLAVVDPLLHRTSFAYDGAGRQTVRQNGLETLLSKPC